MKPPPYADGLEHVRDMLRDVRDAALDASDTIAAEHGPGQMQVGLPLVLLDLMILQLDGAKEYRDALRVYHWRSRRLIWINGMLALIGFVLGGVSLGLWLFR
jgi:hypothetical protein